MPTKQSVYLETTILGYLTARHSQDLIVSANQLATRQWWDEARPRYEIFISDVVLQ